MQFIVEAAEAVESSVVECNMLPLLGLVEPKNTVVATHGPLLNLCWQNLRVCGQCATRGRGTQYL